MRELVASWPATGSSCPMRACALRFFYAGRVLPYVSTKLRASTTIRYAVDRLRKYLMCVQKLTVIELSLSHKVDTKQVHDEVVVTTLQTTNR